MIDRAAVTGLMAEEMAEVRELSEREEFVTNALL